MMARGIMAMWSEGEDHPPWLLQYRSSYVFILVTVSIAIFTDIFLYAVIVPVIPFALTVRVGVSESDVQHWVSILLAVYGAALLAASPLAGWLADKWPNRRLPLLVGLLALAGSTLMLCLGTSITLLVLGRILQGISAAIVWTVGLALLADTVGPIAIGQAMGFVSMSMSIAILIAPLLGGVVYAKVGYYPVYYMAFGMIILDIILRLALIEKKVAARYAIAPTPSEQEPPLPAPTPASTEKTGTPTEKAPAIRPSPPDPSPSQPHPSTNTPSPSTAKPLTPLRLLFLPRILAALYTTLTQSLLLTAWDAVLPLHLSLIFHWTSLGAGLIFLPLILPTFVSPLVGRWSDRHGAKLPVVLGFVVAVPFLVCLRFVDVGEGERPKNGEGRLRMVVVLCVLLAGLGSGLAVSIVPLLAEVIYVVRAEEERRGVGGSEMGDASAVEGVEPSPSPPSPPSQSNLYATAYGLFNAAWAGGMLLGPLFGGFVMLHSGWGTMCWGLGILSVGGAAIGAIGVGEKWVEDMRGAERSEVEGEGVRRRAEA